MVRGICRDFRSIVDCLGMCRTHTRRYTIRRRALYHGGILVHGVNFITIARSFSDTFAGIAPTGVSGFIIAQIAGMLLAVGVGRWLWRT